VICLAFPLVTGTMHLDGIGTRNRLFRPCAVTKPCTGFLPIQPAGYSDGAADGWLAGLVRALPCGHLCAQPPGGVAQGCKGACGRSTCSAAAAAAGGRGGGLGLRGAHAKRPARGGTLCGRRVRHGPGHGRGRCPSGGAGGARGRPGRLAGAASTVADPPAWRAARPTRAPGDSPKGWRRGRGSAARRERPMRVGVDPQDREGNASFAGHRRYWGHTPSDDSNGRVAIGFRSDGAHRIYSFRCVQHSSDAAQIFAIF